ncbi:hypothetical protein EDB81DRAFT_639428 [Dactylonectria macrodidyma]|uniref:C2H2-type domain-containing protein n=1 Tax=Dactylonectria macrodidyma TaxID=307937 RepID=A0A9P9FN67_9HYPO|nr:hypothetical protein EDB81DRAFT_639428 [Dactylonectria macrodidyma]
MGSASSKSTPSSTGATLAPSGDTSPEPARIVSDVVSNSQAAPIGSLKLSSGLATHPKILAMQANWEKEKKQTSTGSPSTGGLPGVDAGTEKKGAPAGHSSVRAEARRFTDAAVNKQMNRLTSNVPKISTEGQIRSPSAEDLIRNGSLKSSVTPTPSRAESLLTQKVGERVVAILLAESDRPYSMYKGPDGVPVSARGVLIPANYKMHDHHSLPFICPVRDCRRLFSALKRLGAHFSAAHCTLTFNDNGDGTLSKVGSYIKHGPGGTPGIVVSREPLPPDAPPAAVPSLPLLRPSSGHPTDVTPSDKPSLRSSAMDSHHKTPLKPSTTIPEPSPKDPPALRSEVKDYLHRFLLPTQKTYKRVDVRDMIARPRKRDLPEDWLEIHRNTDLDSTHYACALAYLTGDEVTGPEKCVSFDTMQIRSTARLSHLCIIVPPDMHISAKKLFSIHNTCVGCRYWSHLYKRRSQCDWAPKSPMPGEELTFMSGTEEDASKLDAMDLDKPGPDPGLELDPRRTRRRLTGPMSEAATPSTTVDKQPAMAMSQASGSVLEMEEWEVAPGRMTDETSSETNARLDIAFSNSYLTSGQPVPVSEDISFNVVIIKPGSSKHWGVECNKLRTVSVAAGKVKVTIDEKTFQLGPNGMFIVRPGQTCKVDNRLYIDSMVHCTTIEGFDLQ